MKTLSIILLSCFVGLTVWAQTTPVVTIKVNGNRNKEVRVDGQVYTINTDLNAVNTANAPIVINQLSLGQHKLEVVRLNQANNTRATTTYFTVRAGYDLKITVNANGSVQLSETRIKRTGSQVRTPVTTTVFNSLLSGVQRQGTSTGRSTELKRIFATTSYYFTAVQVKQLIQQVSNQTTRLELSKIAYGRVVDPNNYTVLNDLLTTQSRRNELESYVDMYDLNHPGFNTSTTNTGYIAMTDGNFSQLYTEVENQGTASARVSYLSNIFSNSANYFSTEQVQRLLQLAYYENDRLMLAKAAYNNVVDPANYTQLYQIFNYQSSRDELATYINSNSSSTRQPITTSAFNSIYNGVAETWPTSSRYNKLASVFASTTNYFSVTQVRQLIQLVYADNERLLLAKSAYDNITDPVNFELLGNLFTSQSVKNEFMVFAQSNGNTSIIRTPMTDTNFNDLYNDIRFTFGLGAKMSELTKVFNNSANYFTTAQAKQLIQLVSSESNRLELAKSSYDNITDPVNFTQIYDIFSSQYSKNELDAFVKTYNQ